MVYTKGRITVRVGHILRNNMSQLLLMPSWGLNIGETKQYTLVLVVYTYMDQCY